VLRRWLLVVMLSGAFVIVDGHAAHACSCAALPVAQSVRIADAAFVGTVARAPDVGLANGQSSARPVTWVFEVESVLKGELPAHRGGERRVLRV
jgi:hypothetical protein